MHEYCPGGSLVSLQLLLPQPQAVHRGQRSLTPEPQFPERHSIGMRSNAMCWCIIAPVT
jgi:hypothetical protein